jgi:hypothetical protein
MPRKSAPQRKPASRSAKPKRQPKKGERDREAQYARFLGMAEEIGASKDPKDFDRAFKRAAGKPK